MPFSGLSCICNSFAKYLWNIVCTYASLLGPNDCLQPFIHGWHQSCHAPPLTRPRGAMTGWVTCPRTHTGKQSRNQTCPAITGQTLHLCLNFSYYLGKSYADPTLQVHSFLWVCSYWGPSVYYYLFILNDIAVYLFMCLKDLLVLWLYRIKWLALTQIFFPLKVVWQADVNFTDIYFLFLEKH